jgi:hypothetical protein
LARKFVRISSKAKTTATVHFQPTQSSVSSLGCSLKMAIETLNRFTFRSRQVPWNFYRPKRLSLVVWARCLSSRCFFSCAALGVAKLRKSRQKRRKRRKPTKTCYHSRLTASLIRIRCQGRVTTIDGEKFERLQRYLSRN